MHGPAGFDQALVSKAILFVTCSFTFAAQVAKKQNLFSLDLAAIGRGQVWRLLTHHLCYATSSDFVLGTILLYNLSRMFERMFGARKFAACVLFLSFLSTALQVSVLGFSRGVVHASGWQFAPGPYALIFGLLAMFALDVPSVAPFKIGFISLSEKVFIYILALQLAFSNWPGSAYTTVIPLLLGLLYRVESFPFHRLRIPAAVSTACGNCFRPVLSLSFSSLANLAGPQGGAAAGGGGPRFFGGGNVLGRAPAGNQAAGAPGAPGAAGYAVVGADDEPRGEVLNDFDQPGAAALMHAQADPAALQQLMNMGFPEERARPALVAARNNVAAATNLLLSGS